MTVDVKNGMKKVLNFTLIREKYVTKYLALKVFCSAVAVAIELWTHKLANLPNNLAYLLIFTLFNQQQKFEQQTAIRPTTVM